jgi:hypothetical protein
MDNDRRLLRDFTTEDEAIEGKENGMNRLIVLRGENQDLVGDSVEETELGTRESFRLMDKLSINSRD